MANSFQWDIRKLSLTQKNIADFIEKNVDRIPFMNEKEIAQEVPTSIASVSRFWQAVGYANLKEFKSSLRELEAMTPAKKMSKIFNKVTGGDLLGDMLEQTAGYLHDTSYKLARENFDLAVEKMSQARRIYVFAPGPSEGLGSLLQFRLNRFGVDIQIMPKSGNEVYEALLHLTPQDVIIGFGFLKLAPEIQIILEYANELKCTTIIITDRLVSDLNDQATIVLYVCRGELWEFHSMVAPTAVVESIIIAVGLRIEGQALSTLETLQTLRRRSTNFISKA
ncbi:MurR/RpiR family transcriptional regulator [Paenibacillus aceris]|uniref:DNA-binding MurR/RpiR family transcriptional regulator n=1 Tax=Paenibacillus aceris TaxID=869555 RepID=A0ABS4I852_9BACL|nr:MurR/RpiR family transcriptional regulator [Paenibacillus aceris]MBP1967111.1 DNA-binding MurR/RpiR family transcriptional regulator [Paenibacillus aceris]NHW35523.1 MurR/RpiR family transcriptional regulator [Paenibacillus aceris]